MNHHYTHAVRSTLCNMLQDLLLICQILPIKFHSHQNTLIYMKRNLNILKFLAIESSPLLESANIKTQYIEKHFTPSIPVSNWCLKKHVIKDCEKIYERSGKNLFWSIENSGEILDKFKARDFNTTSLSTYDFSTLYTTLPYNFIKDKLIGLIERTFQREGSPYLACNDRNAFFTLENPKN